MGRQAGTVAQRTRAKATEERVAALPVIGGRPPEPPSTTPEGWVIPEDASALILLFDILGRPLVSYRVNINEAMAIAGMLITVVAQTDAVVTQLAGRIGYKDAFVNPEPAEELTQDQIIPTAEELQMILDARDAARIAAEESELASEE